jgi:hypothetical protein
VPRRLLWAEAAAGSAARRREVRRREVRRREVRALVAQERVALSRQGAEGGPARAVAAWREAQATVAVAVALVLAREEAAVALVETRADRAGAPARGAGPEERGPELAARVCRLPAVRTVRRTVAGRA